MANGSGIPTNVTWHVDDHDNKCHNGEGNNDRPCLFRPITGMKNNQSVNGTLEVKENVPVDSFLINAWLATSNRLACNVTLILENSSVPAILGNAGKPNDHDCAMLTEPKPCKSEQWFYFTTTIPAGTSKDKELSIAWDDDQGSIIFDDIVGQYQPSAGSGSSVSQTSDNSSVPQSTASPSITTTDSKTAISQFSTGTLPSTPSPTSNDSPPVRPSAGALARHRPSRARTIAPAVIVPVVFVVAAIVGYFLWRRRRRLARIAPSARFKGESPEMKPWLPLDAQRSVSRQD